MKEPIVSQRVIQIRSLIVGRGAVEIGNEHVTGFLPRRRIAGQEPGRRHFQDFAELLTPAGIPSVLYRRGWPGAAGLAQGCATIKCTNSLSSEYIVYLVNALNYIFCNIF